jgi:hypothetical protein
MRHVKWGIDRTEGRVCRFVHTVWGNFLLVRYQARQGGPRRWHIMTPWTHHVFTV